jgi:AcrR family transcriptional regulator
MPKRPHAVRTPRPRRGTPEETRERLIAAAAEVFNTDGYHGTDTNRLARAAGYAPATFYKHFPDKLSLFLAVYEGWISTEWIAIAEAVRAVGRDPDALAAAVVELVVDMHRKLRGLRQSLRAVVATEPEARAFYRAQRKRQLATFAGVRASLGVTQLPAEHLAFTLYTLERTADAIAEGELRDLGLSVEPMMEELRGFLRSRLG